MIFQLRSSMKFLLATLSAVLLLTSCQFLSTSGSENQAIKLIQSNLARDLGPDTTDAELEELVNGNTDFALALYKLLSEKPGNQFFSPLSTSLALAMTYGGARGQTATEMAEALRFTLSQSRLHTAFNALDLELSARNDPGSFELAIANSTWGALDYEFLASYLDLLAVNYGAAMRLLDFAGEPEKSRGIINEWVSDRTKGKIEELLPEGTITPMTALVLTNAIYFNAKWETPFPKQATGDGPFTLLNGTQVALPMMSATLTASYSESDGVVAIELPYKGGEAAMLILMPEREDFAAFEDSLTGERLAAIIAGLSSTGMHLTLPKFSFSSEYDLVPHLQELGMRLAFSEGQADFSGMDGTRELLITDVVQKAFLAVDEEGTEAAAATGVVVGPTSAPGISVRIDHPFIFVIRDRITKTLLFVGRVLNPLE